MRPRCPFYGFEWPEHSWTLRETADDNRCGLLFDDPEPCRMEASGRTVDMHKCDVANRYAAMLHVIGDRITFLSDARSRAVPYSNWREQVMKRT